MRVPLSFTHSIVGVLTLLVLLGCRDEQTKSETDQPKSLANHAQSMPPLRFVQVDVHVVDSTTTRPVVGADVF
jgi:hypothetical protein